MGETNYKEGAIVLSFLFALSGIVFMVVMVTK